VDYQVRGYVAAAPSSPPRRACAGAAPAAATGSGQALWG
jgi:hypothetical protein